MARQASSAHDALHDAMDLIEALSQDADVAISTPHALDGEPTAWAKLAAREGSLDCAITDSAITDSAITDSAITDSTVADLITHH